MKYINGIKVNHNSIDWTGFEIGRLKIIELVGKHHKRRTLLWKAQCSCGNICEVTSAEISAKDTKSCGCLRKEVLETINKDFSEKHRTHGMSGTIEQKAWKRIKGRCTNPNSGEYEVYSKIGISESFAESFLNFYEDIGPVPDTLLGSRISVDRIDNTKGYVEGNVRWANDTMQARNKSAYQNNKSGVVGVYKHVSKSLKESWACNWYTLDGKQKTRYFSIEKYGDELAFFVAVELRSLMIERLNMQGAGYTEKHGQVKENK